MIRQLKPHYRGQGGQLADDPITAAGPRPVLELGGLARLFTTVGLTGEFAPSSFFDGVELVWPEVTPCPASEPLSCVFGNAVAELCADTGMVAIALSGGLDSFAVLVHVLRLRPERRVAACVVDLVDDDGVSAAAVVRRLLDGLDGAERVRLVVIDPQHTEAMSAWSSHGPRPDALPGATAAIAQAAANAGADIVLSGDGADELLAASRFATVEMLKQFGARGSRRYFADMARSGPGVLGELVSLGCRAVPAPVRAHLYWAANWPEWSPPAVSPVLTTEFQDAAMTWAREWVAATIAGHAAARRSWAEADAFDAWWPRAYRPPAGVLPEASPFLHPDVVAAALALPVATRYNPVGLSVHQRTKAQVVDLFPQLLRSRLPRRKQLYRRALAAAIQREIKVPIAADIGLLDFDAVATTHDTATRMMALAVEHWLAGALAAGITTAP